jgi:hypothetical protein
MRKPGRVPARPRLHTIIPVRAPTCNSLRLSSVGPVARLSLGMGDCHDDDVICVFAIDHLEGVTSHEDVIKTSAIEPRLPSSTLPDFRPRRGRHASRIVLGGSALRLGNPLIARSRPLVRWDAFPQCVDQSNPLSRRQILSSTKNVVECQHFQSPSLRGCGLHPGDLEASCAFRPSHHTTKLIIPTPADRVK